MVTLLIEDWWHGTDELAEVHVPLKAAGEGYLCKVGRRVSMVRASAVSSGGIKLADLLLLLFRSRQSVH